MPRDVAQSPVGRSFMDRWGALVVLCLSMFIVVLDSTMMNVAIPRITEDLDTSVSGVQSVISSYSMIMAALMLAGAKLGAIHGPRRIFRIALFVYGAGTAIAALSQNLGMLFLGWSVIEGVAAAALVPLSMALVIFNYRGKERALAFGVLGGFQATAAAVGPIFGGFLTSTISWRVGFGFEVAIVILVLAIFSRLGGPDGDKSQSLDWVGTILSVAALASIVFGSLLAGRHGWWTARRPLKIGNTELAPLGLSVTAWLIVAGLVFFVLFVHWQKRRERIGETPLIHMRLLANGTFITGFTTDALQSVTLAGLLFVTPLFLQQVLGFDPFGAGVALLPASIAVLVVSFTTTGLGARFRPKSLILIGAALMGAGLFWMAQILSADMSAWVLAAPLAVFGAGTGLLLAQVPNITLSSVEPSLGEEASGVQNATKETGTALGTAVIGSVLMVATFSGVVTSVLQDQNIRLPEEDREQLIIEFEDALDELTEDEQLDLAAQLDELTGGRIEGIVVEARVNGMKQALEAIGGFVVLAFLAATFLPRKKMEDEEHPAQPGGDRIARVAPTPQRGV